MLWQLCTKCQDNTTGTAEAGQTWDSVLFHVPSQCCSQGFVCLTSGGVLQEVLFPWGRGGSSWRALLQCMVWRFNQTFLGLCYVWNERRRRDMLQRTLTVNCAVYWLRYSLRSVAVPVKIICWKWRLSPPRVVRVWRVWHPKSNMIQSGKHIFIFLFIQFASPLPFFFKVKKRIYYFKSYRMMIISVARIWILFPNFCCYVIYFYGTNPNILCSLPLNSPEYKIDFITIIIIVIIHFIVNLSEVYKWRHWGSDEESLWYKVHLYY